MHIRRNVIKLVGFVGVPLLLFNFQNCAPPAPSASRVEGQARVVEDLNKAQLQFVTPELELKDDVINTSVDGFCNRQFEGAKLGWAVWAGGQNPSRALLSGASLCRSGNFKIELVQLDQLTCGISHMLVVEGEWGSSTFSHFTRRCQPLVSQNIVPPTASPGGTICVLEYSPVLSVEHPCIQICYRDAKVVLTQPLEIGQCSSLASSLAGQ